MTAIASCPQCRRQLSVPDAADFESLVRCPICRTTFPLAGVEISPVLDLILVPPAEPETILPDDAATGGEHPVDDEFISEVEPYDTSVDEPTVMTSDAEHLPADDFHTDICDTDDSQLSSETEPTDLESDPPQDIATEAERPESEQATEDSSAGGFTLAGDQSTEQIDVTQPSADDSYGDAATPPQQSAPSLADTADRDEHSSEDVTPDAHHEPPAIRSF